MRLTIEFKTVLEQLSKKRGLGLRFGFVLPDIDGQGANQSKVFGGLRTQRPAFCKPQGRPDSPTYRREQLNSVEQQKLIEPDNPQTKAPAASEPSEKGKLRKEAC